MCHVVVEDISVLTLEIAFLGEGVAVHEGLDDALAVKHSEGETTVEIGLNIAAGGIVHVVAVNAEAGTLDRNAGNLVHDEA